MTIRQAHSGTPGGEGPIRPATWANCRAHFAFDGALIDPRVPGTGPAAWEAVWGALRSGRFAVRAFREGEPIPPPGSAREIFAARAVAAVLVTIMAGPVRANCHFLGGDFELDIDPREVADEAAFGSVLALMRFVAVTSGRAAFAVAEGGSLAEAFLRVAPDGLAVALPAGSTRDGRP